MHAIPPPSKPSFEYITELISSIQQQMEYINPTFPSAGKGLQLYFAEEA
jgi:hypothetical protein